MFEALHLAFNAAMLVAMGASAMMWITAIWFHRRDHPLRALEWIVPARPQERPFWTPAEVLIMFGTMFLVSQILMLVATRQGWIVRSPVTQAPATPEALFFTVIISSLAGIAAVAAVLGWLRLIDKDAWQKLGLRFQLADVKLGLKASLVILPPVLLISALSALLVPYEHPVLETLKLLFTPTVFAATFVGTAIVTPFVEELMIRVLLQGGLQGLVDRGDAGDVRWRPQSYLPIVIASTVFALLHLGQGAAPIPLFVLALGLGFLYRQTGSITPPLIVHVVLNSLTLTAELIRLQTV